MHTSRLVRIYGLAKVATVTKDVTDPSGLLFCGAFAKDYCISNCGGQKVDRVEVKGHIQ